MITYLKGEIIDKDMQTVVLKTGDIGYEIFVTGKIIQETTIGSENEFWTYHAVKDNAEDLYGFLTRDELSFFKLLLTINGVGPKSALSILNSTTVETLTEGIQSGDATYLSKISGIGKKSAEKIVLALKDKLGAIESVKGAPQNQNAVAIDALVALGYSERESREAIAGIESSDNPEKMIKEALKGLGK